MGSTTNGSAIASCENSFIIQEPSQTDDTASSQGYGLTDTGIVRSLSCPLESMRRPSTPAAIGLLGPYGPQQPDDCRSPWSLCSPKAAETPQACAVRMASQSAFPVQPLGKHVTPQQPWAGEALWTAATRRRRKPMESLQPEGCRDATGF